MKKLLFLLIAFGFMISVQAQEDRSIYLQNTGSTGERGTTDLTCPPGTLYSHAIYPTGGFTSALIYRVYDQIEATPAGLVNELTFYGIDFDGFPNKVFEIGFFHDNAGVPGAAYYTDVVSITAVSEGGSFYSYPYSINPGISVSAGDWISVFAEGDYYWYWVFATGGDGCVYQAGSDPVYRCDFGDVAFCLGSTQEVPVSPWAIALGIGLIAVAVVLRTRRMI